MSSQRSNESCPACGAATPTGADYCPDCAAPLARGVGVACPACEEQNPARARFCLDCGAPLATVAEADRRVVTVLFADLSGFTQLTEQLDPEQVRELVAGCLDRLCDCITRWGGFVDKFIGDCVMALFGAPVAYENEEERAVRAAIDMHAALEEWSVPGIGAGDGAAVYRPKLRIGINTGPVVTGLFSGGGARNYTAVGDTVNVASRLQGATEPGRILVGATTYQQTRHLFEYGEEEVLQVKGHREPVRARHVLRLRATRGRARGFQGRRTALVGRERELAVLRERWQRAKGGEFQLCLVTGPAGIGKSRLVEELIDVEALGPEEIATGHSYPHASSTPWEPVAELIRNAHRVTADLHREEAVAAIVQAAPELWTPEDIEGLSVALGTPISDVEHLGQYSSADRADRITRAVARAIQTAVAAPRVLILEDLHWADHTTLDYLCGLSAAGPSGPILTILVARPPLPGETLLARLMETVTDQLDLPPLTPQEARAFLDAVLEVHELPEDFIERVVGRAEGNPLFIEETLKSLVDGGALTLEDGVWRARSEKIEELQVPDTIESVLTTRIDRLDNTTKRVLQYAAIVGRRFWSGVLADALAHRPVDQELDRLLEGAFVRAQPFSTIAGDREFLFEHLLLQEVAYEGLLRGLRAELHGAVARWLVEQLGDQATEYDEWVAFHYERSKEPYRALPFLERAARAGLGRGAILDAQSLTDRALEIALRPEDTVPLLCLAEEIAAVAGDTERRRQAIEGLESIADAKDDDRAAAEGGYRRARYLLDCGDLPGARAKGKVALDLFEKLEDISQQGDVLRLLGRVSHLWGDYPEALRFYRSSLPLERQAGDRYGQAEIFDRLGLVQVDLGNFTTGLDYFDAARDLCVELGHQPGEARVLGHRAIALRWLGQNESAEETARAAVELADRCRARQAQLGAEFSLAEALAARGDVAEALTLLNKIRERAGQVGQPGLEARAWLALAQTQRGEQARESAQRARELAREAGLVHAVILALTVEADLDLDAGDVDSAEQKSGDAIRTLDRHGSMQGPEEAVLHTRARVLKALGREDESAELLKRARTIVRNRADRIEDPTLRNSYLQEIPLNREIIGQEVSS